MINATVTHIGQSLDLKTKSFAHTIKLQLPDGSVIGATVDEQAVQLLMKFVAEDPPEQQEAIRDDDAFTSALYDGQPAQVFGEVLGGVPDQAPEPEEREDQLPLPKMPVRVVKPQPVHIKTVPKDDYGMPIMQHTGTDVNQVLGDVLDDDGVPSI